MEVWVSPIGVQTSPGVTSLYQGPVDEAPPRSWKVICKTLLWHFRVWSVKVAF